MSKKQQTAVDFLHKKLHECLSLDEERGIEKWDFDEFIDSFEQAWEMEKNQIVEAYKSGENSGAEKYYQETYKP